MILTHFDNDHSGGAVDLYNNLKIKNTYVNSLSNDSLTSKRIYETIKPLNIAKNNTVIYTEPNLEIKIYQKVLKLSKEKTDIITKDKRAELEELINAGKIIRPAYINVKEKNEYTPLSKR